MPYSSITLSQLTTRVSDLLDDRTAVYWTQEDIQWAVYEGMYFWGAITSYWRQRGVFNLNVGNADPYYDLSVELPNLRSRSYTLDRMVKEIQFMLLEAPNGISGAGMSQQVSITTILNAIQDSRNRFVLDVGFPLTVHNNFGAPDSPDGVIQFSQNAVYVHRVSWLDATSMVWTPLWRSDAWNIDKSNPTWTLDPALPNSYSIAETAPLSLQLAPAPLASGVAEALTVDSFDVVTTNPGSKFNIPDEWIHAVKYAALSLILSSEGQIKDMVRAQYAEERYQQSVNLAKNAKSIIRLLIGNTPLPLDDLSAVDAACPYWRNMVGMPYAAGALYDLLAFNPGVSDAAYGITADVVMTAPLPAPADYVQMGEEEIENLLDYVCHILTFKCGGKDFTGTMSGYDSFMKAASKRGGINQAQIKSFDALFGQYQKDLSFRPDMGNS